MIKEKAMVPNDEGQNFDKMHIALAIKNSTFNEGLSCSLLDDNIIDSCNVCNLECICEELEVIAKEYVHNTRTVINTFKFQ